MNIIASLISDSYKQSHYQMYPKDLTKLYSNFTARKSRKEGINKIVFFGLQYYILEYLIKAWNDGFFNLQKEDVIKVHTETVKPFSTGHPVTKQWENLHELGYLPIRIKAVPEGTRVPIGVPMLTVTNTHPDFAWFVNFIETQLSMVLWMPITSATIADDFKKDLVSWAKETGGDPSFVDFQGHDFSMRGMPGLEAACLSGSGHLTSFKGSDTIPAASFLKEYYGSEGFIAGSVAACFPDGTEVLTNKGFKLFEDLDEEDLVAQVVDGVSEFVTPTEYHEYDFDGDLCSYKTDTNLRYVDISVTPNHRMVGLTKKGKYIIKEAQNFNYHSDLSPCISTFKVGGRSSLTSYEKLLIAFQADGSFSSRTNQYTGKKTGTIPIRFSLKKERKAERLRLILNDCKFEFTETQYENGYYSFRVTVPQNELLSKTFTWVDLNDVDGNWCKEFIQELQYWDGYKSRDTIVVYSSTEKYNIDVVCAICALSNSKSHCTTYYDKRVNRKPLYSICIDSDITKISGGTVQKENTYYKGKVRCVSVPSGIIVVKQNERIIISGNSEHSVMSVGGKDDEIETFERLLNTFPEGILSVVSDTWDLWQVCTEFLPKLKDKILARNGKLVIRPDSGDPADIICGKDAGYSTPMGERGKLSELPNPSPEVKGVVELLWDVFGGTINEKGYKVLDPHIGAIYGDSITSEKGNEICRRLKAKGFCSTNIVFGIGSFSYQFNTRDTFGMAMKATYCEKEETFYASPESLEPGVRTIRQSIFKDPVTDSGEKRSAKGLLAVIKNKETGELELHQEVDEKTEETGELKVVFEDGRLVVKQSLDQIRNLLNETR